MQLIVAKIRLHIKRIKVSTSRWFFLYLTTEKTVILLLVYSTTNLWLHSEDCCSVELIGWASHCHSQFHHDLVRANERQCQSSHQFLPGISWTSKSSSKSLTIQQLICNVLPALWIRKNDGVIDRFRERRPNRWPFLTRPNVRKGYLSLSRLCTHKYVLPSREMHFKSRLKTVGTKTQRGLEPNVIHERRRTENWTWFVVQWVYERSACLPTTMFNVLDNWLSEIANVVGRYKVLFKSGHCLHKEIFPRYGITDAKWR